MHVSGKRSFVLYGPTATTLTRLHVSSDSTGVGVFHTPRRASYSQAQFRHQLESEHISQVKGSASLTADPSHQSRSSPVILTDSCKWEVPMSPLFGFNHLLEQLTNLRELRCFPVCHTVKDALKDTDEQPEEKTHMSRSVRVPSRECLCPWCWDVPACWHVVLLANKNSVLHFRDFNGGYIMWA